MATVDKNWDRHVLDAHAVSLGDAFQGLRDRILTEAQGQPSEQALDVGAGTGLLTLPLAAQVSHLWAIDISPAMCSLLEARAQEAGVENIEVKVCSADELPLEDACVELVVSNYCLHHLDDPGKARALAEIYRVLKPGGRLVFADMMFSVGVRERRDRRVLLTKTWAMIRKGPAGVLRLIKNLLRLLLGGWEKPAPAQWWEAAMREVGFAEVRVETLAHEGGLARGRKPSG
jgi:ubiquinone/menaquinone biosynthesis C-methylase UbiE